MVNAASLEFAESYRDEDDVLVDARRRADEVGVVPVAPSSGATLQLIAAITQARAVVELGTGTGVSGLWMLRGMARDGVLTSVDLEAEHQRHARAVFAAAGFATQRFRLIAGSALEVMPRLTKAGYDIVFIDADKAEYGEYLDHALALLRPGGVVCVDNVLWHDRVADPKHNDAQTVAIRDLVQRMRTDDRLTTVMLPVGDGMVVARLRET